MLKSTYLQPIGPKDTLITIIEQSQQHLEIGLVTYELFCRMDREIFAPCNLLETSSYLNQHGCIPGLIYIAPAEEEIMGKFFGIRIHKKIEGIDNHKCMRSTELFKKRELGNDYTFIVVKKR